MLYQDFTVSVILFFIFVFGLLNENCYVLLCWLSAWCLVCQISNVIHVFLYFTDFFYPWRCLMVFLFYRLYVAFLWLWSGGGVEVCGIPLTLVLVNCWSNGTDDVCGILLTGSWKVMVTWQHLGLWYFFDLDFDKGRWGGSVDVFHSLFCDCVCIHVLLVWDTSLSVVPSCLHTYIVSSLIFVPVLYHFGK